MIYLDNNATTKPDPNAIGKAAELVCSEFGNPSSTHSIGESARAHIEQVRALMAKALKCKPTEVYFTSGGTEANNLALHWAPELGDLVIGSKAEHSSIYNTCIEKFRMNSDGTYDLNDLEERLKKLKCWGGNKIVATSLVNNETGVYPDPDQKVWELCQKYGARHHVDAVQAFGKFAECSIDKIKCDTLSVSAHKFHGVSGTGVLYVREDLKLGPIMKGGSQERGLRPGTENKFGILVLGELLKQWLKDPPKDLSEERNYLETSLNSIAQVNGKTANRIGNTSSLFFPDVADLDLFLATLDELGLCVSGKSACSSGMPAPSRVIEAMFGEGSAEANGTIRVSLSKFTTRNELDKATQIIAEALEIMRSLK